MSTPVSTPPPVDSSRPAGRSVRLRVGTRARTVDGHALAISAGANSVVVDDARAEALWTTLEPVLRAGVEPERLLARVPQRGRDLAAGILARLDAHQLLREVDPDALEIPALVHLEAVTRRPGAAARLVATTTLRVTGDGPVAHDVATHLGAVGYAHVETQPGAPGDLGGYLLARVERRACDGTWHPVAFALGDARTVVVGPGNRDTDDEVEAAALARLTRGTTVSGAQPRSTGPQPGHHAGPQAGSHSGQTGILPAVPPGDLPAAPSARDPLTTALVAAQLALAVLASTGRAVEDGPPARWPELLVTTDGVVSEQRTHVALPRLTRAGHLVDVDAWPASRPHDEHGDPAALERLAPVWDSVLGVIGEPLPLDLPQLPAGLAALVDDDGRTLGGVGATTAAARIDAALGALREVASGPAADVGGTLGLGTSASAARADAVARLAERSDLGWRPLWRRIETLGADVRSLHLTLTRHLGRPVSVSLSASEVGLHRVDVRDPDGELLGRAVASGAGAAAHGALLRAVGRAQWQASGTHLVDRDPLIDVLDTRSPAVRTQIDLWALSAVATGALQLVVPERAGDWATVGLHAVVASWT